MAKKEAAAKPNNKVNKAAAVRAYQAEHPAAKPKEIVDALAAQGIVVAANYIATVRYHQAGKGKKGGDITVDELQKAQEVANQHGGIAQIRANLAGGKAFVEFAGGDYDRAEKVAGALASFLESLTPKAPAAE